MVEIVFGASYPYCMVLIGAYLCTHGMAVLGVITAAIGAAVIEVRLNKARQCLE